MKDHAFFYIFYNYHKSSQIFKKISLFFEKTFSESDRFYFFLNAKRGRVIGITLYSPNDIEMIQTKFLQFIKNYIIHHPSPPYYLSIPSPGIYLNYMNNSVELNLFNLGLPIEILDPGNELGPLIFDFCGKTFLLFSERHTIDDADKIEAYILALVRVVKRHSQDYHQVRAFIRNYSSRKFLDSIFNKDLEQLYVDNKSNLEDLFEKGMKESQSLKAFRSVKLNDITLDLILTQFSIRLGMENSIRNIADYLIYKYSEFQA